eukprot:414513-Pelagomonas_calceolata.AAC.1
MLKGWPSPSSCGAGSAWACSSILRLCQPGVISVTDLANHRLQSSQQFHQDFKNILRSLSRHARSMR